MECTQSRVWPSEIVQGILAVVTNEGVGRSGRRGVEGERGPKLGSKFLKDLLRSVFHMLVE